MILSVRQAGGGPGTIGPAHCQFDRRRSRSCRSDALLIQWEEFPALLVCFGALGTTGGDLDALNLAGGNPRAQSCGYSGKRSLRCGSGRRRAQYCGSGGRRP